MIVTKVIAFNELNFYVLPTEVKQHGPLDCFYLIIWYKEEETNFEVLLKQKNVE